MHRMHMSLRFTLVSLRGDLKLVYITTGGKTYPAQQKRTLSWKAGQQPPDVSCCNVLAAKKRLPATHIIRRTLVRLMGQSETAEWPPANYRLHLNRSIGSKSLHGTEIMCCLSELILATWDPAFNTPCSTDSRT